MIDPTDSLAGSFFYDFFNPERGEAPPPSQGSTAPRARSLRSSFERFCDLAPPSPSRTESPLQQFLPRARSLDEKENSLNHERVRRIIELQKKTFAFPHYTVDSVPECKKLLCQAFTGKITAKFPFTVLTWIAPSLHKEFLDESHPEHVTVYYVDRRKDRKFSIASFDSIAASTTRRFIQTVRTDLSDQGISVRGLLFPCARQKSLYGCAAFALDDLTRCQTTPDLLKDLKAMPQIKDLGADAEIPFPPEFMVSTQSFTELSDYMESVRGQFPTDHPRMQQLSDVVHAHTQEEGGKKANRYIAAMNEQFFRITDPSERV